MKLFSFLVFQYYMVRFSSWGKEKQLRFAEPLFCVRYCARHLHNCKRKHLPLPSSVTWLVHAHTAHWSNPSLHTEIIGDSSASHANQEFGHTHKKRRKLLDGGPCVLVAPFFQYSKDLRSDWCLRENGRIGRNMKEGNEQSRISFRRGPFSPKWKLLLRVRSLGLGYTDFV